MAQTLFDSNLGEVKFPGLTPTTIDGMAIGGTTPAAGAFTTLTASAIVRGVAAGLTASTTQTLAGGLALTKELNVVATSANSGDAVTLPALAVGQSVTVFNAGANPIKVFPNAAGVAIDGGTAGAAVTLTNAKRAVFVGVSATVVLTYQLGVSAA